MKKITVILISIFISVPVFAKTYSRDGFAFTDMSQGGRTYAFFSPGADDGNLYGIVGIPRRELHFLEISKARGAIRLSQEEADVRLFEMYEKQSLDGVLKNLETYSEKECDAVLLILCAVADRVATISDKRKIMDFFMDRAMPEFSECARRGDAAAVDARCRAYYDEGDPLAPYFLKFAAEKADFFSRFTSADDCRSMVSYAMRNTVSLKPAIIESMQDVAFPPQTGILSYVYAQSCNGKAQGMKINEARLLVLTNRLGEFDPAVRLLRLQSQIEEGKSSSEMDAEFKALVDSNFDIAFPVAAEYARKNHRWEDMAYYSYLCLKQDVYGLQKQDFRTGMKSWYFDYLEVLFAGLANTDVQAAGTLYEFVNALPKNMRTEMWLWRAGRFLDGVSYDAASAKTAGARMAEQGYYENAEFEKRFQDSLRERAKELKAKRAAASASAHGNDDK